MGAQIRSALLAGFIAGFIWMFIANLARMNPRTSALVGLGFVIAGTLVTALVASFISKGRSGRA